MIEKIKQLIETQTSLLRKKAGVFKEDEIECAIDEEVVDCEEIDEEPYVGIPAPILTPVDDWFSGPYGCPTEKTTRLYGTRNRDQETRSRESSVLDERIC